MVGLARENHRKIKVLEGAKYIQQANELGFQHTVVSGDFLKEKDEPLQ